MTRLSTFTLFLVFAASACAQTAKPEESKKATVPAAPKPVVQKVEKQTQTTSGPKGKVITPFAIKYGESSIPGDSEVLAMLGELNSLSAQYAAEEKSLQEKYTPLWMADQAKIQQAIQKVKDANKWGDDVIFNGQTKQWIKLDPSEVEAMKKVTPPAEKK